MSRESLVLLLGLIVFFVPFAGIPSDWKTYIFAAIGVLLMLLGFLLRRSAYLRKTDRGNGERGTDSFIESQPTTTVENDMETDMTM